MYVNQDKVGALQLVLSGADMVSMSGTDSSRQVFRQRALAILQQTIEDAFRGKRQFLSGNDLKPPSDNVYSILFCSIPLHIFVGPRMSTYFNVQFLYDCS